MGYEELLTEVEDGGIEVFVNNRIGKLKGLYVDNTITLNTTVETNKERKCVLAEELGHYHTTVGNILDQSKIENRKQELKARRWAVKRLIRVEDFIDAFNNGVQNQAELAEFLEVTEEFVHTAIDHFKGIHGYSHKINDYTIIFEPLIVYKNFE